MYELLESLWERGYGRPPQHANIPLSAIHNHDGYTPTVLAASLGKTEVFCALWERSRELQWQWGPISCHVYPLHFIDDSAQVLTRESARLAPAGVGAPAQLTKSEKLSIFSEKAAAIPTKRLLATIGHGGSTGRARSGSGGPRRPPPPPPAPLPHHASRFKRLKHLPTALEVAVAEAHLDILIVPRMQQLLDRKWNRFASRMFMRSMFLTAGYLSIFALASIMRSNLLVEVPAASEGAEATVIDARRLFRPLAACPSDMLMSCAATTLLEWTILLGAAQK
jgi:hypothetical protein